jgi:hypothetical protein
MDDALMGPLEDVEGSKAAQCAIRMHGSHAMSKRAVALVWRPLILGCSPPADAVMASPVQLATSTFVLVLWHASAEVAETLP